MSPILWGAVTVAGGVGAVARTVVDRAITAAHRGVYPLGIFVVNMAGSFLLGLMTGLGAGSDLRLVAGTGFLGGFTTFSTWIVDARRLADARLAREAVLNIVASLLVGLLVAGAGWALGAWLAGSTRF